MLSRAGSCLTDKSDVSHKTGATVLTDSNDVSHSNLGWLDWRDCRDWQRWTLAWEDWAVWKQKLEGYLYTSKYCSYFYTLLLVQAKCCKLLGGS